MSDIDTTLKTIYNIIQSLWNIILVGLSLYIFIRSTLIAKIAGYIATAETEVELTGKEKMALVVSWVKDLIPRLFRVLFTDKVIELMAQNIYDDMKKYRENFIKKNEKLK